MEEKQHYGYLLGQITAIVEDVLPELEGSSIAHWGFAGKVYDDPYKLMPWLVEVEKIEIDSLVGVPESDFMESVGELLRMQAEGHTRMNMDDKNRFWIGYYHQKARKSIQLTRQRIGHRIKELRESKGMSQRELGKRIDIAYNHIGRIEKGKYNVNLDTLAKIAAALDTEINLICEKAAPES